MKKGLFIVLLVLQYLANAQGPEILSKETIKINRIKSITLIDPDDSLYNHTWYYNEKGMMSYYFISTNDIAKKERVIIQDYSTMLFLYDSLDKLIIKQWIVNKPLMNETQVSSKHTYAYDLNNNCTEEQIYSGRNDSVPIIIARQYYNGKIIHERKSLGLKRSDTTKQGLGLGGVYEETRFVYDADSILIKECHFYENRITDSTIISCEPKLNKKSYKVYYINKDKIAEGYSITDDFGRIIEVYNKGLDDQIGSTTKVSYQRNGLFEKVVTNPDSKNMRIFLYRYEYY